MTTTARETDYAFLEAGFSEKNLMKARLQDKHVPPTDGSRGVGATIVMCLLQDCASVALANITEPGEGENTAAAVGKDPDPLGGIDIPANTAGINSMGPLNSFSLEDLDRAIAINVQTVFVAMQAATMSMKRGRRDYLSRNRVSDIDLITFNGARK